jgi:rRNA-processing protein EBP2
MVTKSKLKMALAADKGTDFKKLHLHKKEKAARKSKAKKVGVVEKTDAKKTEEDWEDIEDENDNEDAESDAEDEEEDSSKVCAQFTL